MRIESWIRFSRIQKTNLFRLVYRWSGFHVDRSQFESIQTLIVENVWKESTFSGGSECGPSYTSGSKSSNFAISMFVTIRVRFNTWDLVLYTLYWLFALHHCYGSDLNKNRDISWLNMSTTQTCKEDPENLVSYLK